MKHAWEEIPLETYEKHMRLDSVRQLQAMNLLMQSQLADYPAETAMILGIAGGNGLEHISREKYRTVYGIDINADFLHAVSERYAALSPVLQCIRLDLGKDAEKLPQAQLLIANLLIEYIGYGAFQHAVLQAAPEYVSCVIQINREAQSWVSDSPYLHAFDCLDAVHHLIDAEGLTAAMQSVGYDSILRSETPLPNGKALLRLDYRKQ